MKQTVTLDKMAYFSGLKGAETFVPRHNIIKKKKKNQRFQTGLQSQPKKVLLYQLCVSLPLLFPYGQKKLLHV